MKTLFLIQRLAVIYVSLYTAIMIVPGSISAAYSDTHTDNTDLLSPPESDNQVIVLVHGFRGLGFGALNEENIGFDCSTGIQQLQLDDQGEIINRSQLEAYFLDENDEGIPIWLAESGFDVWFSHYTSSPEGTPSIAENASCVAQQIAEVSAIDTDGKVIIIAASLGGVVSRYYLEGEALSTPYAENVEKIFTLGTPHKGVPMLGNLVDLGLKCPMQAPLCEVTTSTMSQLNKHNDRAPGVEYYLIGGKSNISNFSALNQIIFYLLSLLGANDGLVFTKGATGIKTNIFDYRINGITGRLTTDESHAPNVGSQSYMTPRADGTKSKAYLKCIEPVLTGGSPECI